MKERSPVKLSLLTYDLARTWSLPKLIEVARSCGYAGIEFRSDAGHQHSAELDRTASERRRIREQLEDAYLEAVGIGTGCKFQAPDPSERAANIEQAKRFIELAADIGSKRVRVFGNDIPPGVKRDDCIRYVGESLRALGEFAEPFGVDVLLEMHGQFNYWKFARAAVEIAGHPRVGIVYNSDTRDMIAGSIAAAYAEVRTQVRHVHLHAFSGSFPYPELFALLAADGYRGYLSSEVEEIDDRLREEYFAVYAALFRAWAGQSFWPMPS